MIVVDGHNLIPKIPGWSLRNIDDEQQLIEALQAYAAAHRKQVEVFFDKAPVGYSGKRSYGRVTAHFVREGRIADLAIRDYLDRLGNAARNATVVSSDRQVQAEARSRGAAVISSDDFAASLQQVYRPAVDPPVKKGGKGNAKKGDQAASLSSEELDEFLKMFGEDDERE